MTLASGRTGLWGRGDSTAAPRDPSVPTPAQELSALRWELTQHLTQQRALFSDLQRRIGSLDSYVYEHDTQELPPLLQAFTLPLQPQTAQMEVIRSVHCSIITPSGLAAGAFNLANAWIQLGSHYLNAAPLITGAGTLNAPVGFQLNSDAPRLLTVLPQAAWPANTYISFALFGEAVPTMDGGVLH